MLTYPSNFLAEYLRICTKMNLPLLLFRWCRHTNPASTHSRYHWMMTHVVIAHYDWGTWGTYHLLVGLTKDEVSDQLIVPLNSWLIHQRVISKEPLVEEILGKELLEHISVNLLLVLCLSWVISEKIMSLENLHDLLSVYWPVLKWANSNLPFILTKVLFQKEVPILIFNL